MLTCLMFQKSLVGTKVSKEGKGVRLSLEKD